MATECRLPCSPHMLFLAGLTAICAHRPGAFRHEADSADAGHRLNGTGDRRSLLPPQRRCVCSSAHYSAPLQPQSLTSNSPTIRENSGVKSARRSSRAIATSQPTANPCVRWRLRIARRLAHEAAATADVAETKPRHLAVTAGSLASQGLSSHSLDEKRSHS